jgi:putative ABC transport system ATP-binding protein
MNVLTVDTEAAARTSGLSKSYGQADSHVVVLDGIDLEFERGRFTALMGPSGSGKSTFLHCLAGLEQPTSGQVWVGETRITGLDDQRLSRVRHERIGFIFQNHNLAPTLTVAENIILPFELAGRILDHDHVELVVQTMDLNHLLLHRPEELSRLEQQRVAAARAFIGRPDVVLADEPTAALDDRSTSELLGLLRRGVDQLGGSVIMVTHDPAVAAVADRVVFFEAGRIAEDLRQPTTREVLRRLTELRRKREGPLS